MIYEVIVRDEAKKILKFSGETNRVAIKKSANCCTNSEIIQGSERVTQNPSAVTAKANGRVISRINTALCTKSTTTW